MRARRNAGASAVGVWLSALADTVWNAPAEWMRAISEVRLTASAAATAVKKADAPYGHEYMGSGFSRTDPEPRRPMMDKLWQDVRYALRLWRRRPVIAL